MGFINDAKEPEIIYKDSVKKYLKPEFIARVNNILVFNDLNNEELGNIINIEIKNIQEKLKEKIKITFDKNVKDFILETLKTEKLHARGIKDIIRNKLQIPLSKFIISTKSEKISIKIIDNQIKIQ